MYIFQLAEVHKRVVKVNYVSGSQENEHWHVPPPPKPPSLLVQVFIYFGWSDECNQPTNNYIGYNRILTGCPE